MFYFKITVRSKPGGRGAPRVTRNYYREFLRLGDLGDQVGTYVFEPKTTSVSVTKISQAAFVRATRRG